MDVLHTRGVAFIQTLQSVGAGYEELMLTMSHLGDPRNAFLLYFPLAYCLRPRTGATVLWLASLSEWINAILKWLLHGERPYWWVRESRLYDPDVLAVNQYRLTCETGPGSPSGHGMVTASVTLCILLGVLKQWRPRQPVRWVLWSGFILFQVAVNVSRCYIATHFPHQVVLGAFIGMSVTLVFQKTDISRLTLGHYGAISAFIPVSCLAMYYTIEMYGLDPEWSIAKATKWCANADWVHLDTTLFNAVYRDAGSLLGFGLSAFIAQSSLSSPVALTWPTRLVHIVLCLALSHCIEEYVKPSQASPAMFYLVTYVKFCLLVMGVCFITQIHAGRSRNKTGDSVKHD